MEKSCKRCSYAHYVDLDSVLILACLFPKEQKPVIDVGEANSCSHYSLHIVREPYPYRGVAPPGLHESLDSFIGRHGGRPADLSGLPKPYIPDGHIAPGFDRYLNLKKKF